jgi:hypothetical protein
MRAEDQSAVGTIMQHCTAGHAVRDEDAAIQLRDMQRLERSAGIHTGSQVDDRVCDVRQG